MFFIELVEGKDRLVEMSEKLLVKHNEDHMKTIGLIL